MLGISDWNYLHLQVSRLTIYDVVKMCANADKSVEGSANPARQSHLNELIWEDPGMPLCKNSTTFGVSEATMHWITKKDLRYTSYVLKEQTMLFEAVKVKRVVHCNLCLCLLRHEAACLHRFLSDEKKCLLMLEWTRETTVGLPIIPRMSLYPGQSF